MEVQDSRVSDSHALKVGSKKPSKNGVIHTNAGRPKHYMGSIVLTNKDKKDYEIIDGQQRITTVTVCILAVISILKDIVGTTWSPKELQSRQENLAKAAKGIWSINS